MRLTTMRRMTLCGLVLLLCLRVTAPAQAQSGGPYDLSWATVDGGGGTSSGGAFTMSGTAGQADAGVLTGGTYTLQGGFWGWAVPDAAPSWWIYLPLVLKS